MEHRLHPVTPLRRAWAPIAIIVGWAVHDPDQAQHRLSQLTVTTFLGGLAALVVAAALYGFLTWWFTHFAVTDTELRIRTGLVFRRTAHIRLDRLQAVDVNQPLLARFVGVVKLKLDVVGTDKKDELAYLGEQDARGLRAELLARAAGFAPERVREVGEAPSRQVLRVPPRTLALSVALTGTAWGPVVPALAAPVALWMFTHNLWTVIAVAAPLLGGAFARTVGRFIAEYDWTVGESPDGLRIDHGLLDRAHETVPPGRVQTVRLVEPLLWRRRGWVRVELNVAGSANTVLLPVAPLSVAQDVVARVLPGVDVPGDFSPAPRRARWCLPLWWRGQGIAVTDSVFAARRGLLRRTVSLVPHAKVQSVRLVQGPWERLAGLADVRVDNGAGRTVSARLRDTAEARALLHAQADRSRTGRRTARPDRWMA
ncbi:PH domain-containing protein [Streptomyces sp. TS71-3]|uniref:PH domain-containing protein n=1 Tax=Streptomyces sp. TS71-3 TaxID=2733862 RepID=UPI002016AD1E|nr:PH domain-containing protein [Streptomyces sp. TS71-3]